MGLVLLLVARANIQTILTESARTVMRVAGRARALPPPAARAVLLPIS